MNRNKYILILILLLTSLGVFSQSGKDKVESLLIGFITKQVNLSPDEAQKFWPLYNEYLDKLSSSRREFKKQFSKFESEENLSEKDAEAYITAEINLKQRESELFKEYYEKFKKVIPSKKVVRLRKAEDDFKRELLKQLKGG